MLNITFLKVIAATLSAMLRFINKYGLVLEDAAMHLPTSFNLILFHTKTLLSLLRLIFIYHFIFILYRALGYIHTVHSIYIFIHRISNN